MARSQSGGNDRPSGFERLGLIAAPARADAPAALRSCVAHLAAGDARPAIIAASLACQAAPDTAEPHYLYGQAWLAAGEPARAEQALAYALRIRPHWADAWVSLGVARYRLGAMGEAITCMRAALRAAPDHAAAAGNLGAFLRIGGEPDAAEQVLRVAIAHDPENAGARLNLAADLLHEERAAEALALLDEIAPPAHDPAAARHWALQRSLALLQLGRWAEVRAVLDALAEAGPIPPEVAPLWQWRQVLLAQGEGRRAAAGAAAARMEAALDTMGPRAVTEHRIMARYDLAKFWSGQGEHATAFAQWSAAHAQLAVLEPFRRDDHLAVVEANIAAFSEHRMAAGPRASNTDATPVFVVGMPRSGTTLCERILAAHPAMHGAGERAALGQTMGRLGGPGSAMEAMRQVAALDAVALGAAADAYLAELRALAPWAARVVDKMPANYLNLGLVGAMLPGARVIWCVRDPRDIGLSIFTFRFHGRHGYAHDLADLGWTIVQQKRLMAHWQAVMPATVLTVRLGDWVGDFDATLKRILAHVGLPYAPECARFHEVESRVRTVSRAQVREPVNARGLGRWRPYARELRPLIAELEAGGALADWPDRDGGGAT